MLYMCAALKQACSIIRQLSALFFPTVPHPAFRPCPTLAALAKTGPSKLSPAHVAAVHWLRLALSSLNTLHGSSLESTHRRQSLDICMLQPRLHEPTRKGFVDVLEQRCACLQRDAAILYLCFDVLIAIATDVVAAAAKQDLLPLNVASAAAPQGLPFTSRPAPRTKTPVTGRHRAGKTIVRTSVFAITRGINLATIGPSDPAFWRAGGREQPGVGTPKS